MVSRTIRYNPVASVKAPRQRQQADEGEIKHKAWSQPEARALLQAAQGTRWEALINLGLAVGARPGELMALHCDDVDFRSGQLTIKRSLSRELVDGKSVWVVGTLKTRGSRRVLSIGPATCAVLRAQMAEVERSREAAGPLWQEHGLLFPSRAGTPLEHSNVKRALTGLCSSAGIRVLPPKALRHTHITLSIREGEDAHIVQRRAGHSTVMTTMTVYRHVFSDEQARVGTDLQRLLGLGTDLQTADPQTADPQTARPQTAVPAQEPQGRRRKTLRARPRKTFRVTCRRLPEGPVVIRIRLRETPPPASAAASGKVRAKVPAGVIALENAKLLRARTARTRTVRH